MTENINNPNPGIADFRNFDASEVPGQTIPPLPNKNKSAAIKRPWLIIIVVSVVMVIGLTLFLSFLNNPVNNGQVKAPPLVLPPIPESK